MNTGPLLAPASIAVVGASTDPAKAGYAMFENVALYAGNVVGVGRRNAQLHDRQIVAGLDELDEPPDLAVLAIPPAPSVAMIEELDRLGVGAAIVCAGGFAEAGPEGAALQQRLAGTAEEGSIRVLGPNTSGIAVPGRSLFCSFVPAVRELPPGRLGVVAQSGGVAHSISFAASNDGVGISAMVGVGNGADLQLAELVELVCGLPETGAVAVHVEGVADGRTLLDTIDRLHRTVPVIAIKAGRSDVDHLATSHTGALTGHWPTAAAMLRDSGAVVVETLTDLIDAAKALTTARLAPHPAPMSGPGVGIVTGQAGPGLLLVDRLQQLGVSVPPLDRETARQVEALLPDLTHRQNPVDTGRPGETFGQVAAVVSGDPAIDLLVLFALLEPGAVDLPRVTGAGRPGEVPILVGTGGLTIELDNLIGHLHDSSPVYTLPDRLARGVWALCDDAANRGVVIAPVPSPTQLPRPEPLRSPPLTEPELKTLLAEVGVASPERIVCASHDEAQQALARLGGPVAVKVVDATIGHKSRVDGVHLDVAEPDQLSRALARIDAGTGSDGADPTYLVERMAPPGLDLIVGAKRDPSWGTVLIVGLGGTEVEQRGRVELFRAPLSVERLTRELRRAGIDELDTVPAGTIADVVALTNTLAALLDEWPDADTIELNPLRVLEHEIIALDALVGTERSPTP